VNELTCVRKWLNADMDEETNTVTILALKRARVAEKFTTLTLKLEILPGQDDESDNEESDDSDSDDSDDDN
jgi:hypothetical protein